jgi:curved DNA-binding protein CbpA
MAADLYGVLGVPRDAKPADIRRAYRRAAKRAHPDGGGTRESFALVTAAVEVLTDEKRREQYDRTGEVGEKPVDQRDAEAMTIALNAVDAVLGAILKRGQDPATFDVVKDAVLHLRKLQAQAEQRKANTLAEAGAIRKLSKRFRSKKGKPNRIGAMFAARADDAERNARRGDEEVEALGRGIAVLEDHEFDVEETYAGFQGGPFIGNGLFVRGGV